ncbi:ethanolamine utilization protein [Paenibacillus selenitireducens]|uniref:histidine kinase n=1 Tax=Paenibacillus selenitireducens TaxID=1324314 RepID=A0A1T2X622_9BACL|nr:sensor histidine kinase [Paenibacillus selenitireducens]OPA75341.1 ethanolamine utilization protein [Paenibacillus selenitireducens]
MINYKGKIARLCKQHTTLAEADIVRLTEIAESFEMSKGQDDVFIDVLSSVVNEAVVVYHYRPSSDKSLYRRSVCGERALRENEPGVLRTLETGIMSQGLVAKTQENHLVRQTVYPIKNQEGIIAVIIYEKDVSANIQAHFDVTSTEYEDGEISSTLTAMLRFNDTIINQLEDAVLIFDKYGFVRLKNKKADAYYRQLGYLEDIQGLHYDNLSLDQTTFSGVIKEYSTSPSCSLRTDVKVAGYYYQVKRLFIQERDFRVGVILHDVTEIKDKEAEIVSKSVAIREIHHRVKNNLQTVASLLRIQGRQSESPEAKKCLNESVSRVLAIAATHELLSTEIEAHVDLLDVIRLIASNIQRCFVDCKSINIEIKAAQSIYLDSDRTVAIALIVNELLQNCYEHAFGDCSDGNITVHALLEGGLVTVEVTDDGIGFPVEECSRNSLGLSIVRSYVKDKLKGKLAISSNPSGTTVTFTFKK